MIINSIKQLLRTPIRTALYFTLIVIVGVLLSIGLNLWRMNEEKIKIYGDSFTTIGTVEQQADSLKIEEEWDASLKDYERFQEKIYSRIISPSELFVEGCCFIEEPEFRPYYLSYAPEYKNREEDTIYSSVIAEFTPLEDELPNKSVKVRITQMLSEETEELSNGAVIWFCDHNTKNPELIKKGSTYVANLYKSSPIHGTDNPEEYGTEYSAAAIVSEQSALDGEYVKGEISKANSNNIPKYYEVNEGFYESETGIKYLELIKGETMIKNSFSVTGTNKLQLLMPFYNQDAYIIEGREITSEEFAVGKNVCIIPQGLAQRNSLKVGDSIELKLFQAILGRSAGEDNSRYTNTQLLNAEGKAYDIFEEQSYNIVGIYQADNLAADSAFVMAENEVVIPSKSLKSSIENNISRYGPMSAATTSFQIQNGTIEEFMKFTSQKVIEDVEITFYDGGYSKLEKGLKQMKALSMILLSAGFIMMILILILFTHLYITANKKRTMIERTLGVSSKQCLVSLLSGVILMLSIGSITGGGIGGGISHKMSGNTAGVSYYNTEYGSNMMMLKEAEVADINSQMNIDRMIIYNTIISSSILILSGSVIAVGKAIGNIKQNPLKLMGERLE